MSNKDMARRSRAEVAFAGVDITKSIRPYLLSLTYTDNQEDEADDLQIKLQDRDSLWMQSWLAAMIDTAAVATGQDGEDGGGGNTYTVVKGDSLWKIAKEQLGSGSRWQEIFDLNKDTIKNANLIYPGQKLKLPGSASSDTKGVSSTGLKIQAVILRENWRGDGKDDLLECGQFELDSLNASGPPAVVTIKSTSLPFTSQVRQTKQTRAWENIKLSAIATQMASENGMTCMCELTYDPTYERVEQFEVSDIKFLKGLCHDAGVSLKCTNALLVLFDQATYESKPTVRTIRKGDGTYTKYNLVSGSAGTKYSSCRVRYADPNSGKVIEGIAYAEDYKADKETNQQLEVTAKVASIAEAQTLAAKRLRLANKFALTVTFTVPGDPALLAGVTIQLVGWGPWSGKFIITQARHTIDGSGGYSTQVQMRRVLEGY